MVYFPMQKHQIGFIHEFSNNTFNPSTYDNNNLQNKVVLTKYKIHSQLTIQIIKNFTKNYTIVN